MSSFTIWLNDIKRWDVKSAKAAKFRNDHPTFQPFGNFVEEATELAYVADEPDTEWPVYGVNNVDGVFLSHSQLGKNFRTPYKKIFKDWFFHNPTRANVGSLGRVREALEHAITSPEYQVWKIKDKEWSADYVEVLLKMPFFNYLVDVHRVGGVKERLYVQDLLQMPIPNRNSKFQSAIVDQWRAGTENIAREAEAIEAEEQRLVDGVFSDVGITIDSSTPRGKCFALNLHNLSRWGVSFNRPHWTLNSLMTSDRYPCRPLSTVAMVNPQRERRIAPEDIISFVPMEAVSSISGAIEDSEDRPFAEVASGYTAFENGDVIWAKITPCMENGKSAIASGLTNGVGFGSTEFHVIRPIDPNEMLSEYLWILLRLKKIREAAARFFTGSAGQQRVPASFLEDLWIPVPDINAQREIVAKVMDSRAIVAKKRGSMKELSENMTARIERQILSGILDTKTR